MTLKTIHTSLACAVFSTLLMTFSAQAQEGKPILDPDNTTKENSRTDNDPIMGENPDSRLNRGLSGSVITPEAPSVTRDTEAKTVKPVAKTAEKVAKDEAKASKKEGDPLSFNFLYYFIEKFKLSDFVE
jgi:hypothetical protein